MDIPLINREISWLNFNQRVLQEAADQSVPLVERIRFLGIYSNNMDEFYRVRVANIRRLTLIKKSKIIGYEGSPEELYKEIRSIAIRHQQEFRRIYQEILVELESKGCRVKNEQNLSPDQLEFLKKYYHQKIKQEIFPILIDKRKDFPKFRDYSIYLAIRLTLRKDKIKYALIQIPNDLDRFIQIPDEKFKDVILLDDIIRLNLREIFSIFDPVAIDAYTFKFTRDAELDLDDDISTSYFEKIEQSIKKRKKGHPVRFVYDVEMPEDVLNVLLGGLKMKFGINTIPGGRYHNFKDFMKFPDFGMKSLVFEERERHFHPTLLRSKSLLETILKEDILLHYPYQRFEHIIDILREAALDPKVTKIKINIYRVAKNSDIMKALLAAIFNGKQVTVVFELQARFDEENNMYWSNKLLDYGAKVVYGIPGLKIHSKLLLIERRDKNETKPQLFSHIGTGNFNENTSKIYTDLAFISANPSIGKEVQDVFDLIENSFKKINFRNLVVSPINYRQKIYTLINKEIANAVQGKPAEIRIKLNNLTDVQMIAKLYEASQAGVKIKMIIRGICCLIPGIPKVSENIEVINLVDRYLEHSRFFIFDNNANPIFLLSSGDLMERNLDNRIEVGVLIKSEKIRQEMTKIFHIHWKASDKTRVISNTDQPELIQRNLPKFNAQKELNKYYSAQKTID